MRDRAWTRARLIGIASVQGEEEQGSKGALSCRWKRKGRERVQTRRYGRYSMGTRVIISQPVPVPPTHDGLPVPVQIFSDGTLLCRQPQVIVIGGRARVRARRRQGESRREGKDKGDGQSMSSEGGRERECCHQGGGEGTLLLLSSSSSLSSDKGKTRAGRR